MTLGKYIHITDEQKSAANDTNLTVFLRRQGEVLLPSGHDKRLASDHSITVRGNQWYDHETKHGGYPIEFVQQFYGVSYPEAVTMLIEGASISGAINRSKFQASEKPFELPPAHSDMRRVFAYLLQERKIDQEVIRFFVHKRLIYESCERSRDCKTIYHNAVFVGTDEHGVVRHAYTRGLFGSGYKSIVPSSNPVCSFHHIGQDNHLYVFESPIDLLSYISLHPQNWQQHSYVALCGLSEQAMLKMLELHPRLNHVVLCLDNDPAGIAASVKSQSILAEKGISCETKLPNGKDWNEDLEKSQCIRQVNQTQVQFGV